MPSAGARPAPRIHRATGGAAGAAALPLARAVCPVRAPGRGTDSRRVLVRDVQRRRDPAGARPARRPLLGRAEAARRARRRRAARPRHHLHRVLGARRGGPRASFRPHPARPVGGGLGADRGGGVPARGRAQPPAARHPPRPEDPRRRGGPGRPGPRQRQRRPAFRRGARTPTSPATSASTPAKGRGGRRPASRLSTRRWRGCSTGARRRGGGRPWSASTAPRRFSWAFRGLGAPACSTPARSGSGARWWRAWPRNWGSPRWATTSPTGSNRRSTATPCRCTGTRAASTPRCWRCARTCRKRGGGGSVGGAPRPGVRGRRGLRRRRPLTVVPAPAPSAAAPETYSRLRQHLRSSSGADATGTMHIIQFEVPETGSGTAFRAGKGPTPAP